MALIRIIRRIHLAAGASVAPRRGVRKARRLFVENAMRADAMGWNVLSGGRRHSPPVKPALIHAPAAAASLLVLRKTALESKVYRFGRQAPTMLRPVPLVLVRRHESPYVRRVKGMLLRDVSAMRRTRSAGVENLPPAYTAYSAMQGRRVLADGQHSRSFAPLASTTRHDVAGVGAVQVAKAAPSALPRSSHEERRLPAQAPPQHDIREALTAILNQQGRQPPSGMSGFDARLTPAWAGRTY